ncbi:hypothetical protein ACHWQZ_G008392 [Mnemiopsis leidyi]
MIVVAGNSIDTSSMEMESESTDDQKRFIYFNPNFCINNINVKELVLRAEQSASRSLDKHQLAQSTLSLPSSQNYPFGQLQEIPSNTSTFTAITSASSYSGPSHAQSAQRSALLPTPPPQFKAPPAKQPKRGVAGPSWIRDKPFFPSDVDWNDRDHPWYHKDPRYASNLLNLAADYAKRPNQYPKCRMPPLSKRELLYRMEKLHRNGKLLSSLHLPSAVEKFIRYMRLIKDQIEFDMLRIDYSNNQTYAECRRKRAMMKGLGVNKYHYVNEEAVEELFARSQNLKGYKKQIRQDLDLSKLDTSKLSPRQRRFLFKHHVFKQGKRVYVNTDQNKDQSPKSPNLVSVNKFKAVSKESLSQVKKNRIRQSLRYRRSEDPAHQDCRFYMKTGKCKFGVRCIRKHDPSKLPAKLKKAVARKRPKSSFTVNNVKLPRRPVSSMPPPLVPISSLNLRPTPLSSTNPTQAAAVSSATNIPKTVNSLSRSLSNTDYRFINNPVLGPTKVGLNKKLVNRALKWKRKTALRRKQDCMFFIRRGKCVFGEECRKRHDPAKVALCSRFIFFNRCQKLECPYQHKLIKEKMPLCLYFYANQCSKEDCPFLHVKLGTDVPVCEKFTAGHCDKGSNCTKRHTRDCETHFKTGFCLDTDCKLLHEKILRSRTFSFSSIENAMDMDRPYFDGDDFIPIGLDRIEENASPDILRMLDSDVESIAGSLAECD